jgi:hypothetical protein
MTDEPDHAAEPDHTAAEPDHTEQAARAERRAAHLLPEERAAGSADPRAQAEVILDESDIRESDRTAAPDSFVEHRTSEQAAD